MASKLHLAAVYRRRVRARLARVWENVFDWEHLPSLHAGSFAACELVESRASGWTVRLGTRSRSGAQTNTVRLEADRPRGTYVVRTLDGVGEGSEVRTKLAAIGPSETDVDVGFFVPEESGERLKAIGAGYLELYARLWDEDEAMMRHRETQLRLRRVKQAPPLEPLVLGPIDEVRARLPFTVSYGGETWRLVALGEEIVAHATVCPHWLGPLDQAKIVEGQIRCPWHGYVFDVRSGHSDDGKCLKLSQAPSVTIDADAHTVSLAPPKAVIPAKQSTNREAI
jgi:nitrite reductase/ring-hydroxylating ferredoxin subunit